VSASANAASNKDFVRGIYQAFGRGDAAAVIASLDAIVGDTSYGTGFGRLAAVLRGDRETFERGFDTELELLRDPEGMYYWALLSAFAGDTERALDLLQRTVDRGWMCYQAVTAEPALDPLRADPRLGEIVRQMEARQRDAAAAFVAAGGERLLGLKR